jgi:ATP-dependent RNA helicase DDX27
MDCMIKELLIEEAGDKELQKAMMEARRAENMIKFREEIENRPKRVWLKNEKQKKDIKDKSKEELKQIQRKFDEQISKVHKEVQNVKRKRDAKEAKKQKGKKTSFFEEDEEKGEDKRITE